MTEGAAFKRSPLISWEISYENESACDPERFVLAFYLLRHSSHVR